MQYFSNYDDRDDDNDDDDDDDDDDRDYDDRDYDDHHDDDDHRDYDDHDDDFHDGDDQEFFQGSSKSDKEIVKNSYQEDCSGHSNSSNKRKRKDLSEEKKWSYAFRQETPCDDDQDVIKR